MASARLVQYIRGEEALGVLAMCIAIILAITYRLCDAGYR